MHTEQTEETFNEDTGLIPRNLDALNLPNVDT
jgi:hypothetical protein